MFFSPGLLTSVHDLLSTTFCRASCRSRPGHAIFAWFCTSITNCLDCAHVNAWCYCHSQCLIIKSKYTECLINTSQLQYFFLSTFGVTLLGQFPVVGSTRPSCPDWDQMKKSQNKHKSQMFLSYVSPFPMTHRSQENYRSRDVWMEIRPNETKSPPFLTA